MNVRVHMDICYIVISSLKGVCGHQMKVTVLLVEGR